MIFYFKHTSFMQILHIKLISKSFEQINHSLHLPSIKKNIKEKFNLGYA